MSRIGSALRGIGNKGLAVAQRAGGILRAVAAELWNDAQDIAVIAAVLSVLRPVGKEVWNDAKGIYRFLGTPPGQLTAALASFSFIAGFLYPVIASWVFWAWVLVAQNFAFTYVSRARNSASLGRHAKAAVFSNGVWYASQLIIVGKLFAYLKGDFGLQMAIFTGIYYTAFTMTGSLIAHYLALKSERGKSAVGASAKYAQVPVAEWEEVRRLVL